MSAGMTALRAWASVLAGAYVAVMMFGGAAYWIMRVAGYGASPTEHALRGGALALLSIVGLAVAAVVARRLWKVGL